MVSLSERRWLLPAILLLAVGLRLGVVVLMGDRALEYEFATLTENLLAGRGYSYWSETADGALVEAFVERPARVFPSAYMPPAYPLFLWAVTSVAGTGTFGLLLVEMLQALLGGATVWLVYRLTARMWSHEVGLLAALGVAGFPLLVFTAGQISASALTAFLLALALERFVHASEAGDARSAIVAGAVAGLNVLIRAEFILFLPVAALWLWALRGPAAGRTAALVLVAAAVVMAPWTLRNGAVLGAYTPLTTSGGHNLWQAHGTQSVGTHASYTNPPVPVPPAMAAALDAVPRTPTYEVERDAVYGAFARRALLEDPGRAVRLAFRKAWLLWGHFGGRDILYPGARSPAFWGPWVLLLPFALFGLAREVRAPDRRRSLLILYLGVQTAVAMAFFVLPRYRVFLLIALIPFAAAGAYDLWARRPAGGARPTS